MIPFFRTPWIDYIMLYAGWIVFFIFFWIGIRKKKIISFKRYLLLFLIVCSSALLLSRIWAFANTSNLFSIELLGEILSLKAGFKSVGMILGGVIGLLIGIKILLKGHYWKNFNKIADAAAMPELFSEFLMRIGCFFDGHVLGNATNIIWAIQYPNESFGRHPVALYLALVPLITLIVLAYLARRGILGRSDGDLWIWALVISCSGTFFVEFFAQGHSWNTDPRYLGLIVTQLACISAVLLGTILLIPRYWHLRKNK